MTSSTLDSKHKSDKFYLLISITFILMFELWVRFFFQVSYQEKTIRSVVLKYIEEGYKKDILMLGSSVFFYYLDEADDLYNLGVSGANAYSGLKVLEKIKLRPEVMFVEMGLNTLRQMQGFHPGIKDILNNYEGVVLRRKISHLSRKENNLFLSLRTIVRNKTTNKQTYALEYMGDEWYQRALEMYISRQEKRSKNGYYRDDEMAQLLQEKKALIDEHIHAGVKVYLVRSPEAKALYKVRQEEYEIEEAVFPKDQYAWIDLNLVMDDVVTTDGIHLCKNDSVKAIEQLRIKANLN